MSKCPLLKKLMMFQIITIYFLSLYFFYSYVATDVLLLADVLEKYRKICWNRMGLEALCYISLPSLTFDACLKTTRTKLQIVKDIDLLQMLETGIRGLAFNFTIN